MSRQLLSRATDLFAGGVTFAGANSGKPGAPLSLLYVKHYGAIVTADPDGVSTAQAVAGAGNLTITGALASGGVATFDVPRAVTILSAGNDSGITFTVTGTDEYGQTVKETITGANAGTAAGLKAFKTVTQVAASGAAAGNVSVGTGDVIGLPFRSDAGDLLLCLLGDVAIDAATFVRAVTTDPATATTGDVRGTFNPSAAINGANRFSIVMLIHGRSTRAEAYGVEQYDG
jgi:VCBS repeat-containing protein